MNFFKSDKAVSPIVATLVLIVVAIVGAIAVGVLMGAFNNQVSDQANAGDVAQSYTQELTLAGSTTCYPVTNLLASAYMNESKQVKVIVGEGGSDAGIAGVEAGTIDIGMASKTANANTYPDLVGYQIGGRGVAVIANHDLAITTTLSAADLAYAYENAGSTGTTHLTSATGTEVVAYQRLDGSGTEEAFAKYLNGTWATAKNVDASKALAVSGNEGVLAAVKANTKGIGFVDWGYVDTVPERGDTDVLNLETWDGTATTTDNKNILAALKGDTTKYPYELISPLMYYTKGDASTLEQSFIDYSKSPAQLTIFHKVGVFGISEM